MLYMNYKSRIRNTTAYLKPISDNASFYIVVAVSNIDRDRIRRIGFRDIESGENILPLALGSVSKYNANGRNIIHRELPKITMYRSFEAPGWNDTWHDVTVSYKAYPRTFEAGPEIRLTIVENNGELFISSPKLTKTTATDSLNKHVINLFLDLFGDFQLRNELWQSAYKNVPIRRIDWTMLPPGEYPWSRIESEGLVPKRRGGNRRRIRHTDDVIRRFNPESCAIGNGGFKGYVAFCFPKKGLTLLENFFNGNATYVFSHDWEELSKQTKAAIIHGNLAFKRIEHRKGWEQEIIQLLS